MNVVKSKIGNKESACYRSTKQRRESNDHILSRTTNKFPSIAFFLAAALFQIRDSSIGYAEGFTVKKENQSNEIRRIVFGTAALSKAKDPLNLLDNAYERGFRRFDLARTYGGGESERLFGQWFKTRNIERNDIEIITKGGMGDDKYGSPYRKVLNYTGLLNEVNLSLDSLQVDKVDLYMFHRDDPRIPVSNFVIWANEIVTSGKALKWGVSNWSFQRFCEAHQFALEMGLHPPSSNSPQFSLAVPKVEVWPTTQSISGAESFEHIDWYEQHDIELLCWEVLAKGFMARSDMWPEDKVDTSKFYEKVEIGSDEWREQRIQRAYCNRENYRRRELAQKLATDCGYKLSQVAALYPLSVGKHISVIFGSTKTGHLEEMACLEGLCLDDEALYQLAGVRPKDERKWLKQDDKKSPQGANNVKKFNAKKGSYPFGANPMLAVDTIAELPSREVFKS